MPESKPIDVERARELFDYAPEIGGSCLVWRVNNKRARAGSMAGCPDSQGVWRVKVDKGSFRAHRVAYVLVHGEQPPVDLRKDWNK